LDLINGNLPDPPEEKYSGLHEYCFWSGDCEPGQLCGHNPSGTEGHSYCLWADECSESISIDGLDAAVYICTGMNSIKAVVSLISLIAGVFAFTL